MSVWSNYEARLNAGGDDVDNPKRSSAVEHIQNRMRRKITSSLSYKKVKIEGVERQIAIIDKSGDFNTKKIFALPGDELPHGGLIEWDDAIWLITEVNSNKEFCIEGKMRECNYYLKWLNDSGEIVGRWVVVEDGTQNADGEKENNLMSIGDTRIAIIVGKDDETCQLTRGMRFLIDDEDSSDVVAYQITKPNKLFNVYKNKGVFRFIMNEVNVTSDDNLELRIADYYNWKPKAVNPTPDTKADVTLEEIVSNAKNEQAVNVQTEVKDMWL